MSTLCGNVQWFDADARNWGFIIGDDNESYFVHIVACDGYTPRKGDRVEFTVAIDRKHNKLKATKVRPVE
jgi:cold shock CspA family protein